MIPEEVFKRRHYGTPPIFQLIVVNCVLVCFVVPFFATCGSLNWLFWVFLALLGAYNGYTVYREREEFNKVTVIAYAIGAFVAIAGIFLLLHKNCSASL